MPCLVVEIVCKNRKMITTYQELLSFAFFFLLFSNSSFFTLKSNSFFLFFLLEKFLFLLVRFKFYCCFSKFNVTRDKACLPLEVEISEYIEDKYGDHPFSLILNFPREMTTFPHEKTIFPHLKFPP